MRSTLLIFMILTISTSAFSTEKVSTRVLICSADYSALDKDGQVKTDSNLSNFTVPLVQKYEFSDMLTASKAAKTFDGRYRVNILGVQQSDPSRFSGITINVTNILDGISIKASNELHLVAKDHEINIKCEIK